MFIHQKKKRMVILLYNFYKKTNKMGTLSLFPLSLSSTLRPNPSSSTFRTQLSNPIFYPLLSSATHRKSQRFHFPSKTIAFGSNTNDPKETLFLDENGGVDDMDGYLNYLSLEYDSVWDTKPSWCQPWTIILTGASAIASSWLIWHSVVVTVVILLLICTWWYIFLYSYPQAYSEMIAERRKRVASGVEDTFGLGNGSDLT